MHPCCNIIPALPAAKCVAISDLIFGFFGVFWFINIVDEYGYMARNNTLKVPDYDYYDSPSPQQTGYIQQPTSQWVMNQSLTSSVKNATGISEVQEKTYYAVFSVSSSGIEITGAVGSICLSAIYTAGNLALFVLLMNAINTRSTNKLEVWFWIRLIILIFKCILGIIYIVIGISILTQSPHAVFMIVHLFGLWIVRTLIYEIKEEQRTLPQRLPTGFIFASDRVSIGAVNNKFVKK